MLSYKISLPWLVGGDLNAVLSNDENLGGNHPEARSVDSLNHVNNKLD